MSQTPAAEQALKAGRNEKCPCGSGLKFKNCCLPKQDKATLAPDVQFARQQIAAHLSTIKRLAASGRWSEAIPALREIARLDPNSADAHHDLGRTYFRCGNLAEAVASLQRAVELRPSFTIAIAALAEALDLRGHILDAAAAFRRASRSASDLADRTIYLCKALLLESRLQEAEAELRRAITLAPENPVPHHLLGKLMTQLGLFEAARAQLANAIALSPEEPYAFYDWAISDRVTGADRELLTRVEQVLQRPGLDATMRISVHFGLAKAFDDLGDPAAAMRHYDAANRLKAASVRLDRAMLVKQVDSQLAGFSADGLGKAAQEVARPRDADDELPILILGMPRSGTTLVEQVLSSHPAVAAGGELSFWNDRLHAWTLSRNRNIDAAALAEAAKEYSWLLRRIGPNALRVTDKLPDNFQRIWLIRLAFPEARIIHCRRNPVDTCLSIFFTNFGGRHDYAYDRSDLVFYYRQYQRLMTHWREVLPSDRFIDVDYERLIVDTEATARQLIAFCGLPWDDACLSPERNERAVKTASAWQVRQPVYATSVERWRRYEPWLGELRALQTDADQRRT